MNLRNLMKMSIAILMRDAIFYGYHTAKYEEGKTNLTENAKEYCERNPEYDFDVIMRSYYNLVGNIKTNKE